MSPLDKCFLSLALPDIIPLKCLYLVLKQLPVVMFITPATAASMRTMATIYTNDKNT
jgi:hypothetical protein